MTPPAGALTPSWPGFLASLLAGVLGCVLWACSVTAPTATPAATSSATAPPSAGTASSPSAAGSRAIAFADVCRTSGTFEADAAIEGTGRHVRIHRPATGASRTPLVIALHGNGGSPEAMVAQTGLTGAADEHGFVVAYVAGEEDTWGILATQPRFGRDSELLANLVDTLVADGCVDPGRVILAGFSLGGFLAHTMACTDAERFHIVVAVSARDVSQPCDPARPVTFVAYNGLLDRVVPYAGGDVAGFHLPSAEDWAAAWAARDACSGGPVTTVSNDRVHRLEWTTGCRSPVVLYRIRLGSHVWPGGDPPIGGLSAADLDPTETILRLVDGKAP